MIDQNDTQKQEENGINEIGINGQSNRNDDKSINDEKNRNENRNENGNDEDDDRSLCTNNTDGVVSTNSTEQIVRALGGDIIGVNNSGSNMTLNQLRHHTPSLSPTHIQNRDNQNRVLENRQNTTDNFTNNYTDNKNNFSNNFTDLLIHQQTGTLDPNSNLNSMEYMQIPKSLKLNRRPGPESKKKNKNKNNNKNNNKNKNENNNENDNENDDKNEKKSMKNIHHETSPKIIPYVHERTSSPLDTAHRDIHSPSSDKAFPKRTARTNSPPTSHPGSQILVGGSGRVGNTVGNTSNNNSSNNSNNNSNTSRNNDNYYHNNGNNNSNNNSNNNTFKNINNTNSLLTISICESSSTSSPSPPRQLLHTDSFDDSFAESNNYTNHTNYTNYTNFTNTKLNDIAYNSLTNTALNGRLQVYDSEMKLSSYFFQPQIPKIATPWAGCTERTIHSTNSHDKNNVIIDNKKDNSNNKKDNSKNDDTHNQTKGIINQKSNDTTIDSANVSSKVQYNNMITKMNEKKYDKNNKTNLLQWKSWNDEEILRKMNLLHFNPSKKNLNPSSNFSTTDDYHQNLHFVDNNSNTMIIPGFSKLRIEVKKQKNLQNEFELFVNNKFNETMYKNEFKKKIQNTAGNANNNGTGNGNKNGNCNGNGNNEINMNNPYLRPGNNIIKNTEKNSPTNLQRQYGRTTQLGKRANGTFHIGLAPLVSGNKINLFSDNMSEKSKNNIENGGIIINSNISSYSKDQYCDNKLNKTNLSNIPEVSEEHSISLTLLQRLNFDHKSSRGRISLPMLCDDDDIDSVSHDSSSSLDDGPWKMKAVVRGDSMGRSTSTDTDSEGDNSNTSSSSSDCTGVPPSIITLSGKY